MHPTTLLGRWTAAMIACFLLAGCSLFGKGTPKTRLETLQVIAVAQANRNSATALDVLFVYDERALALLPVSGPAWFQQKQALLNTLGRSIDVVSVEAPPLYRLDAVTLPSRASRAIRVAAYANYLAQAGHAPIDLTAYKHATLRLLPERIERSGK